MRAQNYISNCGALVQDSRNKPDTVMYARARCCLEGLNSFTAFPAQTSPANAVKATRVTTDLLPLMVFSFLSRLSKSLLSSLRMYTVSSPLSLRVFNHRARRKKIRRYASDSRLPTRRVRAPKLVMKKIVELLRSNVRNNLTQVMDAFEAGR